MNFWAFWTSVILFLCLFSVHVTSTTRHHHSNPAREWQSRTQELLHWTCNVPKARLVYINEEHQSRITPNAVWIPQAAVLHRCEQSTGCCANHPTFSCKPTETEEVPIIFRQVNMLNGVGTFERLTFVNHTACACQSVEGSGNDV